MHICLNEAQFSGPDARSIGGGGDAGTSEHQFGLSSAAGVGCGVAPRGSCALALATMSADPVAIKDHDSCGFYEVHVSPYSYRSNVKYRTFG